MIKSLRPMGGREAASVTCRRHFAYLRSGLRLGISGECRLSAVGEGRMRLLRRELAGASTGSAVNSSAVALGVWSMVGGVSTSCGVGGASAIAPS